MIRLKEQIEEACKGRLWWVRIPFLLFFAYVLVNHLRDPMYCSIFKPLNLGLHELGHIIFRLFGRFLEIAGGSLLQCLVPIGSVFMFYRQRDFFAIAICLGWLSINLFDVAVYVGDARKMELPLVSPFGGGGYVIHDWNYLLRRMGWLQYDTMLAFILRGFAVIYMLICLVAGAWIIYQMFRLRNQESKEEQMLPLDRL